MRRVPLLVLLVLVLVAAGCDGDKNAAPAPSATVVALPPLPAPDGLLAELFVPAPEATWTKARNVVGGPAMFLPQTLGGLVATLLGLPLTSAIEIDGDVPALGALVQGAPGERPRAAFAVHVKVGERLVGQLTKGETARFDPKVDEATRITLLAPRGAQAPVALGVLGNYLIVGREPADVITVGPYVVRTLPGAKPPKDDVTVELPEKALSGPIAKGLKATWDGIQPREGARANGAAESAIPPLLEIDGFVEALVAIAGDLAHARLTVNLEPDAVRASFDLTPKPGGGAATKAAADMTTGDVQRLLELPGGTLVALMWRDSPAARAASAGARAATIAGFLGKDLKPADREALEATLKTLAEGRGDWVTAGVSFGPTGPAGYARAAVADSDKLGKAIKGLFDIEKMAPAKGRLAEAGVAVTRGKTAIPGLDGDVLRLKLEKKEDKKAKAPAPPPGAPPSSIEILVRQGKDEVTLAAGYDPKAALKALAIPEATLASVDPIKTEIGKLGDDVAFAAVVEPMFLLASRAGKPGAGESAPVVLAFGRAGDKPALWARAAVANAAVREIVKRRAAF